MTLSKPRHEREVINDLDGDVINLFGVLRGARAPELYAALELTPYAEDLLQRTYACAEMPDDPVERALHFLIRSWFGRGGDAHKTGFRWSKGRTTAPELLWARLPQRLQPVAERLRGICIRSDDALAILGHYDDPDCILFVDPPYPGDPGRRYAVRMAAAQHQELAERLAAARARVILTMRPDTLYANVLRGWNTIPVTVQGGGGRALPEVILTNYPPSRLHMQMNLPLA